MLKKKKLQQAMIPLSTSLRCSWRVNEQMPNELRFLQFPNTDPGAKVSEFALSLRKARLDKGVFQEYIVDSAETDPAQ